MDQHVAGLLLAAGAGTRMGKPKALVRDDDGRSWLVESTRVLLAGGCSEVVVVLGAGAAEAEQLLTGSVIDPARLRVVRAADWASGMGASLRTGLRALLARPGEAQPDQTRAALLHLVDLPDVTSAVVARLLARGGTTSDVLARAGYASRAGHPVLLGRDHWTPIAETADGDRGARDYLRARDVRLVECGDLAGGHDVDRLDQP